VRLRALETDPTSFGSTYERAAAFERTDWDEWADEDAAGETGATLVALRGPEPVGIVTGRRDDHEAGLFHVYAMWVAPEARRDGVGRRLLAEIEAWMTSCGAAVSQLSVTSEAAAARHLYESSGYEPDGEVEESPHTPGLVHVSLRKRLAPARQNVRIPSQAQEGR
jgi:ribosomal protein S18 acetylase RimI-like enzyme